MFWDPRAHMFWISNVQTKKTWHTVVFSKHEKLIGSMRLVYLPTIHLGTYASPMDPMGIGKCERMFFSSQTGSSFLLNALCNGSSLVFFFDSSYMETLYLNQHLCFVPRKLISNQGLHFRKLKAGYPKWWFWKKVTGPFEKLAIFGIYVRFMWCNWVTLLIAVKIKGFFYLLSRNLPHDHVASVFVTVFASTSKSVATNIWCLDCK